MDTYHLPRRAPSKLHGNRVPVHSMVQLARRAATHGIGGVLDNDRLGGLGNVVRCRWLII